MKTQTEVAVIGGGIAGCSTLFHLFQEGVSDCMLLERDEITSGTTWHSAAQVTNFGPNQTMIGLKSHSIRLYKELSEDSEHPVTYHHGTGGLRLAGTPDHLDGYHHFASLAKSMGVDFEVLDPQECGRRHPLMSVDGILGALWDPLDGDIDPAQLCQALLRKARAGGAEVHVKTPVLGLRQLKDHSWIVETGSGDIHAGKIVNAAGYRCNEVAAMMGLELPVVSMEHQYLVTEPIREIEELGFRLPLIRCPIDDFYQRQEKNGLLVGFYERDCKTWGLGGIDPEFSMDLCPDDMERISGLMPGLVRRLPCMESAGVHTVVNGPITYTPDGLPLVGPAPGLRNAYCITGLRAGLGEGGGHGWLLAQIIVHGEAVYDTWCLDPRRFSGWASQAYTAQKAVEDYRNEFRFHMPHEHRPAGRPLRKTSLYEKLGKLGARWGVVNGWERADYFAGSPEFSEPLSFRFNEADRLVRGEVMAVQGGVGIMEVSGFNRYELRGSGVHDWLRGLSCGRVRGEEGRISLCYFLNGQGCVKAEATIANLPGGGVWYGSAAAAESHDMDWLASHLPENSGISVTSLSGEHTMLVVAGPKSRALLAEAFPRERWDSESFPWLRVRRIAFAGREFPAMSVSFSGELAWELHVPNDILGEAFDLLRHAGEPFGLAPFGLRAAESMRLEKGYLGWKSDLITEHDPFEAGLGGFVDFGHEFVGKDALAGRRARGSSKKLATLWLWDGAAPAQPGDCVLFRGKPVGSVTSAGYGYRVDKNLAMGYIDGDLAQVGSELSVLRLGRECPAMAVERCLYDAENARIRGMSA